MQRRGEDAQRRVLHRNPCHLSFELTKSYWMWNSSLLCSHQLWYQNLCTFSCGRWLHNIIQLHNFPFFSCDSPFSALFIWCFCCPKLSAIISEILSWDSNLWRFHFVNPSVLLLCVSLFFKWWWDRRESKTGWCHRLRAFLSPLITSMCWHLLLVDLMEIWQSLIYVHGFA